MSGTPGTTDPLSFTNVAVAKVKELLRKNGGAKPHLRIFLSSLGCSGAQFGFAFDEAHSPDDVVFKVAGVPLIVDSLTYPYLVGTEIDYSEGPEYSDFVIHPAKTSSERSCNSCDKPSCG